jgi:Holliday junction resolvase RusA-like endonuclease
MSRKTTLQPRRNKRLAGAILSFWYGGSKEAGVELNFTVYGIPQPQGSTRAFIPRGWSRPVITTDNVRLKPWRQELAGAAIAAMEGKQMAARGVPVSITLAFYFEKPKSERKSALHKTTKPDVDKLLRAVLDALTGIAYQDDSQVSECRVAKVFGSPARLEVLLSTLVADVPNNPRQLVLNPQISLEAPQHCEGGASDGS